MNYSIRNSVRHFSTLNKKWLSKQIKDGYAKKARKNNLPSRAIYKLEEIDEKRKILRANQIVVDLGSAPGGFTEYARNKVKPNGFVVAIDLVEQRQFENVTFIKGDVRENLSRIWQAVGERECVDVVLSDMSHNIVGNRFVDAEKALESVRLASVVCKLVLKKNGVLLAKMRQGSDALTKVDEMLKSVGFRQVSLMKPPASRKESAELFVLAQKFNKNKQEN